jgi:hypothetical protein
MYYKSQMCFLFTREPQCDECTPLHCPFCIEPTYGTDCREHEMENKHRLRERYDLEELSNVVEVGDHIESFLTNLSNMVRSVFHLS